MNKPAVSVEQLRRVWQSRQPSSEPVRLGVLTRALVQAQGLNKPSPLAYLQGIWDEQVGPELSRHSRLEGFRLGTLRVEVDSAAHMAELSALVQVGLAQQLTELSEDWTVKTIRLRLGSGSASPRPGPTKRRRSC